MSDIRIYGSQGQPLDSETDSPDQRIKDFFFDGVRLAIQDRGTEVEATVFFRARESEASRSEQYYAVYRANSIRDIGRGFHADLVDLVEGKYGMELVTSTDDTTIFQLLVENEQGRTPTNTRDLDDLKTLLRDSQSSSLGGSSESTLGIKDEATTTGVQAPQPLKVGVGSYRLAFGVLLEVTADAGSVVIAENADSSRLSDFTIVIEEGPYNGVTLLGETEQAVQNLRERRRQRRQPAGAVASDPGLLGRHGKKVYLLGSVFGVVLIAVIVLYGSALAEMPLVDGLPLMGGDEEPVPEVEIDSVEYYTGNQTLRFRLMAASDGSLPENATVTARIHRESSPRSPSGTPTTSPGDTLATTTTGTETTVPAGTGTVTGTDSSTTAASETQTPVTTDPQTAETADGAVWKDETNVTDGDYTVTFQNVSRGNVSLAENTSYRLEVDVSYDDENLSANGSFQPRNVSSSTIGLETVEVPDVRYVNGTIAFSVDSSAGEFPDGVNWSVSVEQQEKIYDDITYGRNRISVEDLPPGEYTLNVIAIRNGESRTLARNFTVSTPERIIRFTQGPEYDPAERQVTFTLGNLYEVPDNATVMSTIVEPPSTTNHSRRVGSTMNVSGELATGTYTLNVTLSSDSVSDSINETFTVTTQPLSFALEPRPVYDPTNESVAFTVRAINESVPARANVTVKLKDGSRSIVTETYTYGEINRTRQHLDSGVLDPGELGLEVVVEDPVFSDDETKTVSFNASMVYLGFSDGPTHNESTDEVSFDLENLRANESLPSNATMNVSVENGPGEQVTESFKVTGGQYNQSFAPGVSDGSYDLVVTVEADGETYVTTGQFLNQNTSLAFNEGPDYNRTAGQVTFEMTNAADGFDLPEQTPLNVTIRDGGERIASRDVDVTDGNYASSIGVNLENGTYHANVTIEDDGVAYSANESFDVRNVSATFSEGPEYNATSGEVAFNMTNAAAGFDLPEETTMVVEWLEDDFPTGDSTVVNVTDGAYNRSIAFDEDNGTYTANVTIEANGKHYSEEKPFVKRNVSLNVSYGPTYDESAGELRLNLTNDAENFSLPQTNRMAVSVTNTSGPVNATTLNVTNGNYNRSFPVTLDDSNYTVSVTIQRHSAPVTVSVDLTVGADEADQQNVARQFVARARAT